ncbi:ATP synthase F1 delta subunit [Mycoplasma testudineum]|uniref:ATP synthase subunit delta n=1 Tax=Mycoplasma testudineum TaxID=244584 RepID=A0A4R6IGW6_9MOLU|nr:F0F1 ATP synthase subunit delta [Mycoplasma testudineum]OYD27130.1 hypothetical protein CG473_00605 [Mycoplasma testudineum]TDO21116.1 ATP synthase F1 delta subunit [Mycoplasma testudineum]
MSDRKYDIAHAYSDALVDLTEDKDLRNVLENLIFIQEVVNSNPELVEYLKSEQESIDENKKFLVKIFEPANETVKKWIWIILEQKLIYYLKLILSVVIQKLEMRLGIKRGIIYTTNELSTTKLNQISKLLSHKINKEVILVNKIKPELLAGYEIVIDELKFSNNVNEWLQKFAKEIKKERLDETK